MLALYKEYRWCLNVGMLWYYVCEYCDMRDHIWNALFTVFGFGFVTIYNEQQVLMFFFSFQWERRTNLSFNQADMDEMREEWAHFVITKCL